MKNKTKLVLLVGILIIPFMLAFVKAADLPIFPVPSTSGSGSPIALWTTSTSHSGQYSLHLYSGSNTGSGAEGRLTIMLFGGICLGDLHTLSWWEYLLLGYPPHVDVVLDIDGDGNPDESLNFEYAYNGLSHYNTEAPMPYGAITGAWYQTFSDDGNGPAQIDDTTLAWPNSGPPGPPGSIQLFSLATWKSGVTLLSGSLGYIDKNTVILGFEIEVDNWVVDSEAYIDDVVLNGINLLDYTGPMGPQGATGQQGVRGWAGATGSQGPIGPQGETGLTGEAGSEGPQGPTGDTGPQGQQGIAGETGPQGATGEAGLQGVAGEAGEQGPKGEQGDTGTVGPKGPQGEPAPEGVAYGGAILGGISLLGLLYMFFRPKS